MDRKVEKYGWLFFIVLAFLVRLSFGICSEFWFEDEKNVYLLGLKFFTSKTWPYFGPDVVYTSTQIPGALQALLVGLPFYLFQSAEAPYILLNILSMAGLLILASYIVKLTSVNRYIVYGWLLFCPWTIFFSTNIINPSYVLLPSVLFFISVFELYPGTKKGFWPERTCFFFIGLSYFWIFQIHLSWVILSPVVIYAFYLVSRPFNFKRIFIDAVFCLIGSSLMLALVVPTFYRYGLLNMGSNSVFNPSGFKDLFDIMFKVLAFASTEVPRFIGHNTKERISFALKYYWAAPFIIVCLAMNIVQLISLVIGYFRKVSLSGWAFTKYFSILMIGLLYISFLFSVKGPSAHTFYVLFPLVSIYAFYCWQKYLNRKFWKTAAMITIVSCVVLGLSVSTDKYGRSSMYAHRDGGTGKELVSSALSTNDHTKFGKRRCEIDLSYLNCY